MFAVEDSRFLGSELNGAMEEGSKIPKYLRMSFTDDPLMLGPGHRGTSHIPVMIHAAVPDAVLHIFGKSTVTCHRIGNGAPLSYQRFLSVPQC